jgi:hypothetical protein
VGTEQPQIRASEQPPAQRKSAPEYIFGAATIGIVFVVPLLIAIMVLGLRYSRGQPAVIKDISEICIVYFRVGKYEFLESKFVDCADIQAEASAVKGRYVGWGYGRRVRIEFDQRGASAARVVDMTDAELSAADRGGTLWIARIDHPSQKIVVMPDWTYILTPVKVVLDFLRDNPVVWITFAGLFVLTHAKSWISAFRRALVNRRAGGNV